MGPQTMKITVMLLPSLAGTNFTSSMPTQPCGDANRSRTTPWTSLYVPPQWAASSWPEPNENLPLSNVHVALPAR